MDEHEHNEQNEHEHHEQLIKGVSEEYSEILENSEQGVYIYLDDNHKICNKKLSDMMGYDSPDDWASVTEEPVDKFVAEASTETIINAFWKSQEKFAGSSVDVTLLKKNGDELKANVILVPVSYEDHIFALHFVSPR
jgi:hypothetical protein